jgi:hypothetical protein
MTDVLATAWWLLAAVSQSANDRPLAAVSGRRPCAHAAEPATLAPLIAVSLSERFLYVVSAFTASPAEAGRYAEEALESLHATTQWFGSSRR